MALTFVEQQIQDLQSQLVTVEAYIVTASNILISAEQSATNYKLTSVDMANKRYDWTKSVYLSLKDDDSNQRCGDGNLYPTSACGPRSYWWNAHVQQIAAWNSSISTHNNLKADITTKEQELTVLQTQKGSIQANINDLLATQAAQTQADIDKATAEALTNPETIKAGIEAKKELTSLELSKKAETNKMLIIGSVIVAVVFGGIILFVTLRK